MSVYSYKTEIQELNDENLLKLLKDTIYDKNKNKNILDFINELPDEKDFQEEYLKNNNYTLVTKSDSNNKKFLTFVYKYNNKIQTFDYIIPLDGIRNKFESYTPKNIEEQFGFDENLTTPSLFLKLNEKLSYREKGKPKYKDIVFLPMTLSEYKPNTEKPKDCRVNNENTWPEDRKNFSLHIKTSKQHMLV